MTKEGFVFTMQSIARIADKAAEDVQADDLESAKTNLQWIINVARGAMEATHQPFEEEDTE